MNAGNLSELVIVSGMSGSGKSGALHALEDLGYYCVDNLPAQLLPEFVRRLQENEASPSKIAVGIDVRNFGDLSDVPSALSQVGALGANPRLLFLEARDEVLLRRYADTRRRHPLSHLGLALADAISLDRQALRPLRQIADMLIDTSAMNVHQMRRSVLTEFGLAGAGLSLLFQSFAYRRGIPADADFVFDTRVLPNPHWDARLRPLSGRDPEVREHLDEQPDVTTYVAQTQAFLDAWLPKLRSETRSYVTICFGCTGGRHRSVYLAEHLARHFMDSGWEEVAIHHRELE